MKDTLNRLVEAFKEGKLKYKELNNESTKEKLSESKTSIESKKIELSKQIDVVSMIEKELSYHEMKLYQINEEQTRLNIEKYDDEKFIKIMEELDRVNKDVNYHTDKIAELTAKYKIENEELNNLKETLIHDKQTHKNKLNRLIHDEEQLASEKEKRRILALSN